MLKQTALIFASVLTLISSASFAEHMGIEVGIRQQDMKFDTAGASTTSVMAFQFGLTGSFDITEKILFRSGFLYTQRPTKVELNGNDMEFHFNYLDIPATVLFKFNDYGGVYAGVNVALPVSADCTNCGGADPDKKTVTPLVLGGQFKFAPNFGVDVYYEMLSKINDDVKDANAVGANLLITFD